MTPHFTVRPESPQDVVAIRRVLLAGFPSPGEADLVEALRDAGNLTISLVAVVDGAVAGHAAFSPVRTDDGRGGLGLAPVAVLPAEQRRGVGSALIRAGLNECSAAGWGWVVVLGDPRFYSRFGFAPAASFGLLDEYGGGPAFQALELAQGALPRGAGLVRYGPEFASL